MTQHISNRTAIKRVCEHWLKARELDRMLYTSADRAIMDGVCQALLQVIKQGRSENVAETINKLFDPALLVPTEDKE